MLIIQELAAKLGIDLDAVSFAKADTALAAVRKGALGLGAIAVAVTAGLRALAKGTAENFGHLDDLSKRTGISAESLQEMQYAAKLSGVEAESLTTGLQHLARSAVEAANGGGQAGAAFQRLGISATGADGKARPITELVGALAEKFAAMPDGVEKTALSMEVLGRSGAALIPFFNEGAAGFAKLSAEARKFGIGSDAAVKAGARLDDEFDRLGFAVTGLKNAISIKLFPAFEKSTRQLYNWIAAHRQVIAAGVAEVYDRISRVVTMLAGALKVVGDIVKEHIQLFSILGGVILAATYPALAMAGAFALLADDVRAFNEGLKDGKTKSILGTIYNAFNSVGFQKDPFGKLMEWAGAFFKWFAEEAAKLPETIAKAVGEKKMKTWSDFVLNTLGLDFSGGGSNSFNLEEWQKTHKPAFSGVPGSSTGYTLVGGEYYAADKKTGSGSGSGPAFVGGPINVNIGTVNDASIQDVEEAVARAQVTQLSQAAAAMVPIGR